MSDAATIITNGTTVERNERGRFVIGTKPGPGRPRGSRSKLGQDFITDLQADWQSHGSKVIATVRRDDPSAYMAIVARLLPQEVAIGTPGDFANCSTSEEVLDRLLGDFDNPHEALASFDAMRALLVERIAAQPRRVENQVLPPPRSPAE